MLEEEIFKKSKFIKDRLLNYGFTINNNTYTYTKDIEEDFKVIITLTNNKLKGKIIDKLTGYEYLNYRVENNLGEFSGSIREKYISLLKDIKNKCCINNYFISPQANRISNLIQEKYKDSPEFIFDDSTTAVFRNKANKKWYGIIMYIDYNKLDNIEGKVEIIDIKLNPSKVDSLIKEEGFYRAYHMNKKRWITITLDDKVKDEDIMNLIDESYNFTKETKDWVIPASTKYFDVISYMSNKRSITWKQTSNIKEGDYVYIYVGSPISAIVYKTKAIKTDIDGMFSKKEMELLILKRYPRDKYTFNMIKKYDLTAIRGPRRIPQKLIDKMKEDETLENRKN